MTDLVGQRVGRYEVEALLESLALCAVYLARDAVLGRLVEIKIQKGGDRQVIGGLLLANEAWTLAQLCHPGIVQVHDVGTHTDGRSWFASEHLDGGTLASAIEARTLNADGVIRAVTAAADAVGYAHRRGFVHRMLSERQICFDAEGRVRVVAFGLALRRAGPAETRLLALFDSGSCAAPEQRCGELDRIGPPSDVWALGMVLSEALLHVYAPEKPPRDFLSILERCCAADPADRYPDASTLADALRATFGPVVAKKSRVFVSHSTQDRDLVEREIVGFLERNGIPTWYAKVDIDSATEWERTIVKGLESCDWFLLVMSPRSAASDWVRDELAWAFAKRPGKILPVLLEPCDPYDFHIRLPRVQHVDFTGDREEARRRLLEALAPA